MPYQNLIDIGVNLTAKAFEPDLPEVLERARAAGVAKLVVTGTSEAESAAALELARRHPGVLYATAGIHPHHADQLSETALAGLRALARQPEVVAIGETGLDFNRDFSPRPAQERALERQLELACELGLPVFLHQREAHDRLLPLLRGYRDRLHGAVLHCFTGDRRQLWDCLDLDLHIGITGWICDERRGMELQRLAPQIPPTRLMIETDAPYLLPRDLRPKPRRGRNEPAFLPHVLEAVARHAGRSAETVAAQTTAAARRFFGIEQQTLPPPPAN